MTDLPHHCEECGDDGTLYLSPRCHVGSPVFCYLTGDVLTIECAMCRRIVGRLNILGIVDEELPQPDGTSDDGAQENMPNDR